VSAAGDDSGLHAQVAALAQAVTALLSEVGELRESAPRRRLYDYAEAAVELRTSVKWLQKNIRRLPRTKVGRTVFFTDDDLDQILTILHVEPERTPAVRMADGAAPSRLTPLPGRRSG
jgi:hypothetical protein